MTDIFDHKFDPEGENYDYNSAINAGLRPDEYGHWPSRDPSSGLILKGMKHKTIRLSREEDEKLGYKWIKRNNRYYSIKK
jgi:hypothetical protein